MCFRETGVKMFDDLKRKKNNILGEIDTLNELSKGKVSKDVLMYLSSRLFRLKAELDNVNFLLKEKQEDVNCSISKNMTGRMDFSAQY